MTYLSSYLTISYFSSYVPEDYLTDFLFLRNLIFFSKPGYNALFFRNDVCYGFGIIRFVFIFYKVSYFP